MHRNTDVRGISSILSHAHPVRQRRLAQSGLIAALVIAAGMAAAQPPPSGQAAFPALPKESAQSVAAQPAYSLVSSTAASAARPGHKAQAVKPGETPKGISADAWSRIMADVQARTYAVQPDTHYGADLFAGNPAQHLGVRFTPQGVALTPEQHAPPTLGHLVHAQKPAAPFQLSTRSVDGTPTPAVTPLAAANRVEYRHSGYTEWYVNDAKGFEQGWTLEAPAADGKSPLIRVGVAGARTVAEGADAIRIEDHQGKLRYRYAGLKAWDAGHRELPATMKLARPGRIEIAVDDRGAQYPITIDPALTVTLAVSLSDPSATNFDEFGVSVAVDGDTVVVGATTNGGGLGKAYVYGRNQNGAGAWGLAATLSDPAATNGTGFGRAVAVDGDTVVVGADTAGFGQGRAYVYGRNQGGAGAWGLAATLVDPAASNGDLFGYSVDVDGDTVVVGAYATLNYQGRAYVYSRNQNGTGAWGLAATLSDPAATSGDQFGRSVAVYGDIVVVGSPSGGSSSGPPGTTYIYGRNQNGAGAWGLAATLSDPGATGGDLFGQSVAVDGDTVVVGPWGSSHQQGKAYVYSRKQDGAWALAATLSDPAASAGSVDQFGISVAVNGDTVVVGAQLTGNIHQGKAYVYSRNVGGTGRWGLVAALNDPAASQNDVFGSAVAVDGGTVVVGANNASSTQGAAYIYDISGGSFTQAVGLSDPAATSGDWFGNAVAVDGDTVVVGAYGTSSNSYQGKAYIYSRNQGGAGVWGLAAVLSDPAAMNGDYFGKAVAVDGDTVVVGAVASSASPGKTYIYDRNQGGAGVWGLAVTLNDPGASRQDNFGYSVAVDGDTLVVGAEFTNSGQGSTYVYSRNQGGAGSWGQVATLSESTAGDFGFAVAVDGDTVVVGAFSTAGDQGKSYIYGRNQGGAGSWGLVATLSDPAAATDFFGISVAVDGDTVVVGAENTSNQGKAYIYGRNQGGASAWGLAASLSDPAATTGDKFGYSVAVDGDTMVVGDNNSGPNAHEGKTYIFSRNQGGAGLWGLTSVLSDPGAAVDDNFGYSVAVGGDTVVIGAVGAGGSFKGGAYIYSLTTPVATPQPPTSLTATGSPGQFTLNWTASVGATSYNVYQGATSGGEAASPVSTGITGNSASFAAFDSTTAYFKVTAVNGAGESAKSNEASATTPVTPAPTNLSATPGKGQVTLQWTNVPGHVSYRVYVGTSSGNETQIPGPIYGNSYTVTGLANATTYYFKVAGASNEVVGPQSAEVSAITLGPKVPTNVSVITAPGQGTVSWSAAPGATAYYIYLGDTSGGESSSAYASTSNTSIVVPLFNSHTYYFTVKGVGSGIVSAASSEVSATTPVTPAPTNLTATSGTGQVTLQWTDVPGHASYRVYVGTSSGAETQLGGPVYSNPYTVTGLTSGTTYFFKVAGASNSVVGPQSSEVSARAN